MDTNKYQKPQEKIALTIPTGRPNVTNVIHSFLDNASYYDYDLSNFSVYLSIDPHYQNKSIDDFRLDAALEKKLRHVDYIGPRERDGLSTTLSQRFGIDSDVSDTLFHGRGYSKQRNAALYFAAKDNNDYAICFDDDEAPYIPIKDGDGPLTWVYPDFFTSHIDALRNGADITRGPCFGYLSPIPSDFEKDIPEDIRRRLAVALEAGSDVITEGSFSDLMSKLIYLPSQELVRPSRPFSVSQGALGKHIYAGNMAINLDSFRNGNIPIFYTPPAARGEDTIFALQLEDVSVSEVPSYIFHDPFNMYPGILDANLPLELSPVPVTGETTSRFSNALTGWLKYAPILINLTSNSIHEVDTRIKRMLDNIGEPTRQLASLLDDNSFLECESVLQDYYSEVNNHLRDLENVQRIWKNDILSTISS